MKKFFLEDNWLPLTLIVGFVVLMAIVIHEIVGTEVVRVKGTVVSHYITFDMRGTTYHKTVVRYDDNTASEITGLNTYVLPVGTQVVTEKRIKKQLTWQR